MSSSSSPAMNVLLSDSSLDPLIYDMKSSYPLMSRNKYRVKAGSSWDFAKANSFEIPRFGVAIGAVLKTTIAITAGNADATHHVTPSQNLGNMLFERISLTSHSREIEQVLDVANLVKVLEQPLGQKEVLMDLAHNDESVAITADKTLVVYTPINFSHFTSGIGMAFDTSFVESLEINAQLRAKDKLFDIGANAAATVTLTQADCELMVYFLSMEEANLRKYQDLQYSVERPLTVAACSNYRESAVQFDGTNGTESTVTINFNCPNVCKKTILYITNEEDDGQAGNFEAITSIEYYMSGRLQYEYAAADETKLENAMFFNGSYGIAANPSGTNPNQQNVNVHRWEIAPTKNQFSGGVSGKGISNWSAIVKFTPTATKTYKLNAIQEYVNIVSTSGASGRIGVSLSL